MSSDPPLQGQVLTAIAGFRLVTADLPRLSRFYCDVLGFVADGSEQAVSGDELHLLGLRGSARRQMLRLGDQCVAIEQYDPPGRPYPADDDAACLCFQHLALVVGHMATAYQRVRGATAISACGPQRLPAAAGGVHAYKFRDPDGHPLEFLQFPDDARPKAWRGKPAIPTQIAFGIDHSAISVADANASVAFYSALGVKQGGRAVNHGAEQERLDALCNVQVVVTPMRPVNATPHLELLGYCRAHVAAKPVMQANDIAATRIVWRGTYAALLSDPDGHLQQIASADQGRPQ
jgi:catechol 2,3-dioxygenase-like lactoylglutathione lyase family enzyme